MADGDAPSTRSCNTRLLLRAGNTLSARARDRLSTVFATDDATGNLRTAWLVKEQLRKLLATGSLADAAAAKDRLQALVFQAEQAETNRLWRTVCRWWKEIEVLIVTGVTTAKVKANNTAIKHIKRTGRGLPTPETTKRVSCCAVPPEQRHEHSSRQNIHHEPRRAVLVEAHSSGPKYLGFVDGKPPSEAHSNLTKLAVAS